jgi:hypothetical protein
LKDLTSLSNILLQQENPILLLEGTRKISPTEFTGLVQFGEFIARQFPNCLFRSGNASGSDDAFAQGVRKVVPDRMQIVLPKMDSGKSRLDKRDYVLALEDVSQAEEKQIIYESKRATPKNKRLFEAFELQQEGMMKQKSLYLLRDTLKVLGSPENDLSPITAGIFFVNQDDPESGGTGHTMRVCRQNNVPVFTQDDWMNWMT